TRRRAEAQFAQLARAPLPTGRPVIGVHEVRGNRSEQLSRGVTEDRLPRRAQIPETALDVEKRDEVARMLCDQPDSFLALAQRAPLRPVEAAGDEVPLPGSHPSGTEREAEALLALS